MILPEIRFPLVLTVSVKHRDAISKFGGRYRDHMRTGKDEKWVRLRVLPGTFQMCSKPLYGCVRVKCHAFDSGYEPDMPFPVRFFEGVRLTKLPDWFNTQEYLRTQADFFGAYPVPPALRSVNSAMTNPAGDDDSLREATLAG